MKKVSVIIPVYNAEKYLDECLESVINQSYSNIEVILINDGSTDLSEEICKKYTTLYSNFKLISKANEGVSIARNIGIENATGEYLMFLDSDDYYEKDMVMKMVDSIKDKDLVICGYSLCYKDKKNNIIYNGYEDLDKKEMLISIGKNNDLGGFLCNKIFKKDIINKNNLKLRDDIHYCEDLLFVFEYMDYIKKIRYIPEVLENYRMRKNNTFKQIFNPKMHSMLYVYEEIIKKLSDNDIKYLFKYLYLKNYYVFKKYLRSDMIINYDIINNEKEIISHINLNIKDKMKFLVIKKFHKVYLFFNKIKDKKNKVFD